LPLKVWLELRKGKRVSKGRVKEIGLLSQPNKKLKATKDLLLPKHISGKIDVEEFNTKVLV